MAVPQNAQAIFDVLVQGGLTPMAASGVLGNIQEESGGALNSVGTGGCGLLGYTPCSSAPPGGAVTKSGPNPSVQAQAGAVLTYIEKSYPGGISALDAISDPGDAASSFAHLGERCAACGYQGGSGQLSIRAANARDVYGAYLAGTLGNPTQGSASSSNTSSSSCTCCVICIAGKSILGVTLMPTMCLFTQGEEKALTAGTLITAGGVTLAAGIVAIAAFAFSSSPAVGIIGRIAPMFL